MHDLSTFLDRARDASVVPVVDTMPAHLLTPLSVYLKLSARSDNSFLLESVEGGTSLARYSFAGADPDRIVNVHSLASLRDHFLAYRAEVDPELPAFIGGAIGYMGFECSQWFEPSLNLPSVADEACVMFYRSIVAFDHARQIVTIISLVFTDEQKSPDGLRALYDDAIKANRRIR